MDKISINLLPIELTLSKKDKDRRVLISRISIAILVVVVIVTAVVLSIRLTQTVRLKILNNEIETVRGKVQSYKDQEGLVSVLKTRLTGITTIMQLDPEQAQAFNLIIALLPTQIDIAEFKADRTGAVSMSGQTASLYSLKTFFNNLTDPKVNQGKILSAKVENLSQRSDGQIRFDLSILMIGSGVKK